MPNRCAARVSSRLCSSSSRGGAQVARDARHVAGVHERGRGQRLVAELDDPRRAFEHAAVRGLEIAFGHERGCLVETDGLVEPRAAERRRDLDRLVKRAAHLLEMSPPAVRDRQVDEHHAEQLRLVVAPADCDRLLDLGEQRTDARERAGRLGEGQEQRVPGRASVRLTTPRALA